MRVHKSVMMGVFTSGCLTKGIPVTQSAQNPSRRSQLVGCGRWGHILPLFPKDACHG
jgi:hypothetical protein